ncbi:LLM class flavin-dependent oxidoreductase [Kitasatospora sp. NPDC057015]|uniref:LLM class flavin-dependent oxidoreductase n=1 Tax=Kitasatospora sp. NPDC057015 TaxID=3346001 RepID=UPI00363B93B3
MSLRVGVLILPATRWPAGGEAWRLADEMGFAHAWTYDHLAWRDLLDQRWFAAVPTLAAAAVTTRRIGLGTLVTSPNFRHPVPLVKEALTLSDLSGGRFVLGVGAGAGGPDATVLGRPEPGPVERAERFAEFTALTDRLLREPVLDHTGRHFRARSARTDPDQGPGRALPLAVAAGGPAGMRIAVRHADIWVSNGSSPRPGLVAPSVTPDLAARQLRRVEEICTDLGRPPASLRRLVLDSNRTDPPLASVAAFEEAAGRYLEAGFTDLVVPFPRTEPPYAGDLRVLERIASDVLPGLQGERPERPAPSAG